MSNPLLDPALRVVIAHRGNRAYAAENTLESLQQAVDLGADAIEFDVRVTRDGVPVVLHDPDVDRTTDGHGLVESLTLAEVRELDASKGSPHTNGPRLSVPSLEEVLDRFRAIPLIIEVKEIGGADATERLIRSFGAQERVLVGSAETIVVERFYRSGLRTCASMRDATMLIPIALAGMRPSKPRYDVLSITPRYRGFPVPVVRMAAAARKIGIATHVWTVNEPAVARALWRGGVAGIVTDDPAAMLRAREN
ncbi:MAG TPA: glycerophosphodiester phosphodiesterase family protein [Gemmatimonadaceae bacterium]